MNVRKVEAPIRRVGFKKRNENIQIKGQIRLAKGAFEILSRQTHLYNGWFRSNFKKGGFSDEEKNVMT